MSQDEIKARILAQTTIAQRLAKDLSQMVSFTPLDYDQTPMAVHMAQQILCNVTNVVTLSQCLEKS